MNVSRLNLVSIFYIFKSYLSISNLIYFYPPVLNVLGSQLVYFMSEGKEERKEVRRKIKKKKQE